MSEELIDGCEMDFADYLLVCCRDGDRLVVMITANGAVSLFNERTKMIFVPPQDPLERKPGAL